MNFDPIGYIRITRIILFSLYNQINYITPFCTLIIISFILDPIHYYAFLFINMISAYIIGYVIPLLNMISVYIAR